ncbi:hypothetical protein J4061_004465 [Salmonella enterica]|nr:hypothetical protein [Salmonella enterica]
MSAPVILGLALAICKREAVKMPKMSGAEFSALMEMVAMLQAEGVK